MEKKQKVSLDDYFSNEKNLLEKMAYCPTNMEDESKSIKRHYINPEEISEIFDKVMSSK